MFQATTEEIITQKTVERTTTRKYRALELTNISLPLGGGDLTGKFSWLHRSNVLFYFILFYFTSLFDCIHFFIIYFSLMNSLILLNLLFISV